MACLDNLKLKEKEAMEELRSRTKDVISAEMYEDSLLFYRFLKARDFDINKAEDMLRKHLITRIIANMDGTLEEFKVSEAFKYLEDSYIGEDKEGNMVIYIPAGAVDTRDVLNCFKTFDYYKHWAWSMEKKWKLLKEINKETGKNAWKFTAIVNLDNLKLATVMNPKSAVHLNRLLVEYQDNYPETLRHLFIINAPSFFVIIFSIMKTVIAAEVLRKTHVYGKDGWKEDILKVIDADVLPAFLGGNRTDPDGNPMCNTFINHGGRIPQKYYLSKEDRSFKDKSRVKHTTVSPGGRYEIEVEIRECGCIIQWEIEIHSKDIQFSFYFKESETKRKEIIPLHAFETVDGTAANSYKCKWTGTYIIVLDNTHSWFHSKEVSYCITVHEPTERESAKTDSSV